MHLCSKYWDSGESQYLTSKIPKSTTRHSHSSALFASLAPQRSFNIIYIIRTIISYGTMVDLWIPAVITAHAKKCDHRIINAALISMRNISRSQKRIRPYQSSVGAVAFYATLDVSSRLLALIFPGDFQQHVGLLFPACRYANSMCYKKRDDCSYQQKPPFYQLPGIHNEPI